MKSKTSFVVEHRDRSLVFAAGYRRSTFVEKNELANVAKREVDILFGHCQGLVADRIAVDSQVVSTGKERCALVGEEVHSLVSITHDLGLTTDKDKVNQFLSAKRAKVESDLATLNAIEKAQLEEIDTLEAAEKAEEAKAAEEAKKAEEAKAKAKAAAKAKKPAKA